jgi:hypothetical protein
METRLPKMMKPATAWVTNPKCQCEIHKKVYREFKDEGEVIAWFGNAKLIRFLDGKTELRGGSNDDRTAAREWMSMFWHEAVVA